MIIAGLVVGILTLLASLGFNYLQYQWREQDKNRWDSERAEAQAERARQGALLETKERRAPEIYNADGTSGPIRITGSVHSAHGPYMDLSGGITVVNPTQVPMKITPIRLTIDGRNWEFKHLAFHVSSNDHERSERISVVGNSKQDYNLHFLFPDDKVPRGKQGELWLNGSNRGDEEFSISIAFA